ncbi:hypothetical protein KGS77_17375 [Streptomyces sp. MST-110588]|nr:hypothetical protein KGS77_17375 [Streptomyces sp. MST-110588]
MGLLAVLVSAGSLATVPGTLADADAYTAAPACPAGTPRSGSCTTAVPATVKGTDHEFKNKEYLLLTEAGSSTVRRVRMAGWGPVYGAARTGDKVTVTYWRGEITAVRLGVTSQETSASPTSHWRVPVAIGLGALPFGLGMLSFLFWRRPRSSAPAHAVPWAPGVGVAAGALLGVIGACAAMLCGGVQQAFLITGVGIVPALALAWLTLRRMRQRMVRAADTGDIVPVPPTEKRCLRASVSGDVPYSVSGYGHLVVGDGRPAATPDPDGRFARKELPETLTVQGVRTFTVEEYAGWQPLYKYDGVVIECRDGDRAVRIATRRRDAPTVLGALAAAPTVTAPSGR